MIKMFRLIENEFIKSYKKLSTIILFVMVFVICIGFTALMFFNVEQEKQWLGDTVIEQPDYDQLISDAELEKYTGYELKIEMFEYMKKHNVMWNWRYEACEEAFSYETSYATDEDGNFTDEKTVVYTYDEATRKEMLSIIEKNDWKAYCQYMIDSYKKMDTPEDLYWEYQYRIDNNIPFPDGFITNEDYKNILITDIADAKEMIAIGTISKEEAEAYKNSVKLGLYRLENNIAVNVADYSTEEMPALNIWVCLTNSPMIISFIGLLVAVLAGSIIANEFSQGTIKFLLINPVKRWKILVSKYITCIVTGYGFILIFYVSTILLSMLFFGTSDIGADYIKIVNNEIVTTSGLGYIFKLFMLKSIDVVVSVTLAFAVSSLTKSSGLATGLSVFSLLSGSAIVQLLATFKQDWGRYLIWSNTDLKAIAEGNSYYPNHSLGFAIIVILVHMLVFGLVAWDGFTKKEV
ncbi:MAG: hypothetical protein E7509_03900 [Ruminococcus sp.]|nr:hypothetical protein [Ruminococcus sp.]